MKLERLVGRKLQRPSAHFGRLRQLPASHVAVGQRMEHQRRQVLAILPAGVPGQCLVKKPRIAEGLAGRRPGVCAAP